MSYLRLNEMVVPVAQGGQLEHLEIGARGRAFNGTLLTDVRAIKRKWHFKTKPMTEMNALALIGTLQAQGQRFTYSGSVSYSDKGFAITPSELSTYHTATGTVGGNTVYDQNQVLEVYPAAAASRTSCIAIESSATNSLNAIGTNGPNICTGTDTLGTTGGFTLINTTTLTSDTSFAWSGSRSLKNVCAASGDGNRTADAVSSSSTLYVGTVYVLSTTTPTITVKLQCNAGATDLGTTSLVMVANRWYRIMVSGTTSAGAAGQTIRLFVTANAACTFYSDGYQIEQSTSAQATSWVNGSRSTGNLVYTNLVPANYENYTYNCWICAPATTSLTEQRWIGCPGGNALLQRVTLTNTVRMATTNTVTKTSACDNNWHMYTMVFRKNAETGETQGVFYYDGAVVGTAAAAVHATGVGTVQYGVFNGANCADSARLSEFLTMPWAATAAQVLAWYNQYVTGGPGTTGLLATDPALYLDGDVISETFATVQGRVLSCRNVVLNDGTTWRTNGQVIEFELEEV